MKKSAEHDILDVMQLTDAPVRNRMRVELEAPVSQVWDLIGDFSRFPEYSQGLERVDVVRDAGNAPREFVCHFKPVNGEKIGAHPNRVLWHAANGGWASKDEEPNDFGLRDSVHLVTLAPIRSDSDRPKDGTVVTWVAHYHAVDLEANRAGLDQAFADIGARLVARFGGRVIERSTDGPRSGADAEVVAAVEREVIAAVERMTDAFHRADLEGVMAAYAEGAVVAFEPGRPVSDAEAMRAGFRMFFGFKPRFSYGGHEVLVSDSLAVHFAPWTMEGTGPDGKPLRQNGLSVALLRRGQDGQWRLVIDNPFGDRLLHAR